jgi:hypothetical protein
MNRWILSDEVKEKYKPIIQQWLNKMEKLTKDEIDKMDNKEFCIELSDTELRPYTLLELMHELKYGEDEFDDNGWELDFWINIVKKGKYYPSGCEKLCIHGCGMTFELNLSVKEFM